MNQTILNSENIPDSQDTLIFSNFIISTNNST